MRNQRIISPQEIEKLGNSIIYLAQNSRDLYKTKLLKMLYLLEEASAKKFMRPFLNLDFYVWQMGPISKELFVELSNDSPNLLSDFIRFEKSAGEYGEITKILPSKEFVDDEFTPSELELMDIIVENYGNKSGKDLIDITHQPHSLWYKSAEKEGLLSDFEQKRMNTSDVKIDISDIYNNNEDLRLRYLQSVEEYEAIHSLLG